MEASRDNDCAVAFFFVHNPGVFTSKSRSGAPASHLKRWAKKMKTIFKISLALTGIVAVLAVAGVILISYAFSGLEDGTKRTDEELLAHFQMIRSDLFKLNEDLLPFSERGLSRIDDSWIRPDPLTEIGITDDKLKEFRSRLFRLSIPRGFSSWGRSIEYITYASGMVTGGMSQGYLFSEDEPKNYYKDSPDLKSSPFLIGEEKVIPDYGSYKVYTKIESNWYFYEDYDD